MPQVGLLCTKRKLKISHKVKIDEGSKELHHAQACLMAAEV